MTKTFKELRKEYTTQLDDKGFTVDNLYDDKYSKDGISFSLSLIGLPSVYAEITREEIQYQVDNQDPEDNDDN